MQPKIGLALGGGGIRGFAHLGVLKILKQYHIPVHMIAGTSSGAMAAALYALGADLDMTEKIFLSLNWKSLVKVGLHRTGFVDGRNLMELMRMVTKDKNIEETAIPLRIVAVDLIKRETVVFDQGKIADAVRASIAIPGIFTPVQKEGRLLVDGFVLNGCPGDVVRDMGADIIIAVNLSTRTEDVPENIFDVVLRSLELMSETKQENCADIVITPIVKPIGQLDFNKGTECLQMGEAAARQAMARIVEIMENYERC
ncbi:patatin-like phospholipase family protein [Candidatus Formimonas warabiya]|uniref:PNPLA domain-containing protein n=1 Tax=Formimonas warabiya TaxID=1761012 RepID=A0A3G1KWZ6_FORW1|nr:patatin-like phospholipase family protein [Candidatus Formimonas warabiya]ATW26976.1 hypothetical protein DCMF_21400 [Candidatus Formimonas warabiya]